MGRSNVGQGSSSSKIHQVNGIYGIIYFSEFREFTEYFGIALRFVFLKVQQNTRGSSCIGF